MDVPRWLKGAWLRRGIAQLGKDRISMSYDSSTRVVWVQADRHFIDIRVVPSRFSFSWPTSLNNTTHDQKLALASQLADGGLCAVTPVTSPDIRSPHELQSLPFPAHTSPYHNFATGQSVDSLEELSAMERVGCEAVPHPGQWVQPAHAVARWNASINFQPITFYPEPGLLAVSAQGQDHTCLLEVAPSGEYREEWVPISVQDPAASTSSHLQSPLVHTESVVLSLKGEVDDSGTFTERRGLLIVQDNIAAYGIQRTAPIPADLSGRPLVDVVATLLSQSRDKEAVRLLDSEFSYMERVEVGHGCSGLFTTKMSTLPFVEGTVRGLLWGEDWRLDEQNSQYVERVSPNTRGIEATTVRRLWERID